MGLQHSSLSAPEGAAESKPHDVRKKRVAAQSHVTLLKDVDASVCDHHNTLFLGHLLEWMDAASCLAAEKHCSRSCVTLVMDDLDFTQDHIPRTVRPCVFRPCAPACCASERQNFP
eukprot:TRINITY_DN29412_c1_g1_i1.p1 TRINITY_DN29412_c1_g1~~TRINITY_DN29412_c1_g1_i1.p1  ORF type:complete len:116 (+),score=15.91 TRINITY_DN29412_c1_g1_i1:67-414(+)